MQMHSGLTVLHIMQMQPWVSCTLYKGNFEPTVHYATAGMSQLYLNASAYAKKLETLLEFYSWTRHPSETFENAAYGKHCLIVLTYAAWFFSTLSCIWSFHCKHKNRRMYSCEISPVTGVQFSKADTTIIIWHELRRAMLAKASSGTSFPFDFLKKDYLQRGEI